MTIDHDRFAEANMPPPERVTETPEAEASPEAPTMQSAHDAPVEDSVEPAVPAEVPEALIASMRSLAGGVEGRARLVSISHRVDVAGLLVVTMWSVQDEDRYFYTVRCGATYSAGDGVAYVRRLR